MNCKLACFPSPMINLALKLSLTILMTISVSAYAGGETHGGDAVICFDRPYFLPHNKIDPNAKIRTQPRLLDFWEMEQLYNFKQFNWHRYEKNINHRDILNHLIGWIKNIDDDLNHFLEREMIYIDSYFKYVEQTRFKEIDDSNTTIKPDPAKFCYEVQVALYQSSPLPGQQVSIINNTIFSLMPERDKAGLLLHELIWKYIYSKPENEKIQAKLSPYLRFFTYLLFSDQVIHKKFASYFYMKNVILSGVHFILPQKKRVYQLQKHRVSVLYPTTLKHLNKASKIRNIQVKFRSSKTPFYLPGEVWEPNDYKEIYPIQQYNKEVCLSLKYDDLRNHGSCIKVSP